MKNKLIYIILVMFFLLTGCGVSNKKTGLKITVTSFPCYDVARAIVKDDADIKMLIKPGSEVHTYEPTPKDIMEIEDSDIFIYIGGESDNWVLNILNSLNNKDLVVIKLSDYVDLLNVDGENEYDEHIWTSPRNLIKMINSTYEEIIKYDEKNKDNYLKNKDEYILKLEDIDNKLTDIVNNSKNKELVFADRFPFKYLFNDYGLKYQAAFIGCSQEGDIDPKTLTKLINTVKSKNIPYVLYLELSNEKIADTIISETGCKKMMLHSGQNITLDEFNNGITLADIMNNNLSVIEGALK